MVYFLTDTFITDIGMQCIGKVKRGCPLGKRFYIPFRGKHEYFRGKEVQLDRIQEVEGIRVRTFQQFSNCLMPFIELGLFLYAVFFIFPVCGKSFLSNIVHTPAANLYFHPLPIGPHDCQV